MGYPSAGTTAWVEQLDELRRRNSVAQGLPQYPGTSNYSPLSDAADKAAERGKTNMKVGAFIFFLGALFTAASYSAAVENGGMYVVASGAIVSGAFQFCCGYWQSS